MKIKRYAKLTPNTSSKISIFTSLLNMDENEHRLGHATGNEGQTVSLCF